MVRLWVPSIGWIAFAEAPTQGELSPGVEALAPTFFAKNAEKDGAPYQYAVAQVSVQRTDANLGHPAPGLRMTGGRVERVG
jgi:hypothetical protein